MNERNYKITKFQLFVLDWIARKITIQSRRHKRNITEYYRIMAKAARDEFTEDNKPTLDSFLEECFRESLDKS